MLNNYLKLISILWSIVSIDCTPEYHTALAFKRRLNAFAIGAANYTDLVKKSKIFVDTSLFIEQVLQEMQPKKPVLLMGPNKWGKTINADMLRTFLEIEVDEHGYEVLPKEKTFNYKLFRDGQVVLDDGKIHPLERPLLISHRTKIMDEYMGQRPVIYIDLKHVTGEEFTQQLLGLHRGIREAFRYHDYLLKVYRKIIEADDDEDDKLVAEYNIYEFNKVLDESDESNDRVKDEDIVFLSKLLYKHFKRSPIIILDHFDTRFFETYRTAQCSRSYMDHNSYITDRIAKVVFRQNKYTAGGLIVTSMHVFRQMTINNYTIKDIVSVKDLYTEYFGINQKDIALLFDQYGITGELRQMAHKWYTGYETAPNSSQFIYNSLSIGNFVKTKKIATYWKPHPDPDNVIKMIYETRLKARIDMLSLLSKRSIRIRGRRLEPFFRLMDLALFNTTDWRRNFLWYLAKTGYLRVVTLKRNVDDSNITVQILNNEVANEMSDWLVSHYRQKYNISESHLENAAIMLYKFVDEQPPDQSALEWFLTDLYKRCTYPKKTNNETESSSHAVFISVVLKMQSHSLFEIDVHYNKRSPAHYVIANNRTKQGFIVEVQHYKKKLPKDTVKLAKKFQQSIIEKLNYLNTMNSVLVEILRDRVVRVSMKAPE